MPAPERLYRHGVKRRSQRASGPYHHRDGGRSVSQRRMERHRFINAAHVSHGVEAQIVMTHQLMRYTM